MEEKLQFGYIRKDDDGHNYLVPEDRIGLFDSHYNSLGEYPAYSDEWYDALDDFDAEFGDCRIDGLEELRVVID